MPVLSCNGCNNPQPCLLFVQDDDCAEPDQCPWKGGENRPVWRRLEVVG